MTCQYGSEPRPDARIDAGVLYASDLSVPDAYRNRLLNVHLENVHSPAEIGSGRIQIDVSQLAAQVSGFFTPYFRPEYNINVIFYKDLIGFCEQQPTIDDIPAPLFNIPFFDAAGYRAACLLVLQERFAQNCQCKLKPATPGCEDPQLAGRGQCQCTVYEWTVKIKYSAPYGVGLVQRVFSSTSYGEINFRFKILNLNPGDDYKRLIFQSQGRGDVNRTPGSEFNGWSSPCGAESLYSDRMQAAFFIENPIDPPTYEILYLRRALFPDSIPDDCCQTDPREPIAQPTDPTANDGNSVINVPGDNVTIIVIPGYCDPSACTTMPGTVGADGANGAPGIAGAPGSSGANGIDGEKGDKGDKGDNGAPGTDGESGIPGIQGADGANGAPGANGIDGEKGDKGDRSTIKINEIRSIAIDAIGRAIQTSGGDSDPVYDLEIPDSMEIKNTTVKKFSCGTSGGQLIDLVVPIVATKLGTTAGLYVALFAEIAKLATKNGCVPAQGIPQLLLTGNSTKEQRTFYTQISNNVKVVEFKILTFDNTIDFYSYDGSGEVNGKFGNIGLAKQSHSCDSDPGWIWTQTTIFLVPEAPFIRQIRLHLVPGMAWELWDTGLRA